MSERFEKYVDRSGECWEWTGGKTPLGYGLFAKGGTTRKALRAHRVSYELFIGPIPQGQLVRHKCDNRGCVNPEHLELGTQSDNMVDMVKRTRKYKLTREDAEAIRKLKADNPDMTQQQIADRYGVGRRAIGRILSGERWAW